MAKTQDKEPSLVTYIGIGFTQVSEIFNIFPDIIRNVFAENCVAVVFVVAVVMNLVLPKEETVNKQ